MIYISLKDNRWVWINKGHVVSISSLRDTTDGYELRMSNSDRYFITEDVGNKILDLFDLE